MNHKTHYSVIPNGFLADLPTGRQVWDPILMNKDKKNIFICNGFPPPLPAGRQGYAKAMQAGISHLINNEKSPIQKLN